MAGPEGSLPEQVGSCLAGPQNIAPDAIDVELNRVASVCYSLRLRPFCQQAQHTGLIATSRLLDTVLYSMV